MLESFLFFFTGIKEFMGSEEYLESVNREALERYKEMLIKIIIWCNERKEDPA